MKLSFRKKPSNEETLFWCLIVTKETQHDRVKIFKEKKSMQDFFNWLEEKRKEVANKERAPAIIKDIKYIVSNV